MADFVAVLKKTLDGLGETTPQMRAKVYDKARSTVAAKLAAIQPPPPAAVAERQTRSLEDAIETVENTYAPTVVAEVDPLSELDNIFSSIDKNKNQSNHVRPSTKMEPASPNLEARPTPSWRAAEPAVWTEQVAPELPVADEESSYQANERRGAHDEQRDEVLAYAEKPEGKRSFRGLIAAAIALLVVGGGAYGVWLNKDAFQEMFASSDEPTPVVVKPVKVEPSAGNGMTAAQAPAAQSPAPNPATGNEPSEATKFTQRLMPDGKETDPGPAGGESGIGEGTSVVALTTPPPPVSTTEEAAVPPTNDAAAAPATPESPAVVPIGQKAIFYEERTNVAQGSAEPGSIVWSIVQESPGGDAPPEPAIRGEATIPGKDVQLRLTIRRNADQTLPASHIIEMIFLTPDGFEGGGIENVLRIAMKAAEQEAGSPLIGIPAKIADGYFLVALNDTAADENANMTLLRNQEWIDVPVIYKSGRRALLTMEKGIPGDKVFDDALKAWQTKSAG